jgi:hypothetical protein
VSISFTTSPAGAATRYTTDGSDPATSPTARAYSGPFGLPATATLRYRSSTTNFATAEAAKSTPVRIDAAPPTVTLTSPTAGATIRRGASVTLRATAADAATAPGAASGLTGVAFVLDGNTAAPLTTDTTSPYQVTWPAPQNLALGAHTLTAVATDAAGNRTTSAAVAITVTR